MGTPTKEALEAAIDQAKARAVARGEAWLQAEEQEMKAEQAFFSDVGEATVNDPLQEPNAVVYAAITTHQPVHMGIFHEETSWRYTGFSPSPDPWYRLRGIQPMASPDIRKIWEEFLANLPDVPG